MKKIIAGVSVGIIVVVSIVVLRLLVGRGNYGNTSSQGIELDKSDSQVQIALNGSMTEKISLLKSEDLTEQGILAFCAQEEEEQLQIDENELRKLFEEAFRRVKLSSQAQVQIAELGSYLYNRALLQSPHLTGAGLVAVCQNCQWMDLDNEKVQAFFKKGFKTAKLTSNQVGEVVAIGNKFFTETLLLKQNLTGEELVAICSNPGHLDLERNRVQRWFSEAFERTELSVQEQLQVIELDKEFFNEALLDSSNLTGEALVEVCRYASSTDSKVRSWIEEAFERVELTSKQQVTIAKLENYHYCKLLALADNLSEEAFVELCSPESPLDRENDEHRALLKEAFKKVELTKEYKSRIGLLFIKELKKEIKKEEHE